MEKDAGWKAGDPERRKRIEAGGGDWQIGGRDDSDIVADGSKDPDLHHRFGYEEHR